MILNVFILNPIRPDFIQRCLETMYQHTDMSQNRVIVVDQTMEGIYDLVKDKVQLYMRPHRNLGFAKSMNEGIIHGLRWGSEYITCMNDDVEFINSGWWDGIMETFSQDEKIMAVNPNSPREPGWGYGLEHGKFIDLLPYKESYTQEEYDFLLKGDFSSIRQKIMESGELPPEVQTNWEKGLGLPASKVGVIDAIATWCTVFKRESFEKIGLFDERYYPGGGEDYDLNARAYRESLRMVGTTRSWVWHWWGKSKDTAEHKDTSLPIVEELRWMKPDELWLKDKNGGQPMDPWGKWTDDKGEKHPMYRVPEIAVIDI